MIHLTYRQKKIVLQSMVLEACWFDDSKGYKRTAERIANGYFENLYEIFHDMPRDLDEISEYLVSLEPEAFALSDKLLSCMSALQEGPDDPYGEDTNPTPEQGEVMEMLRTLSRPDLEEMYAQMIRSDARYNGLSIAGLVARLVP